jgi:hypothetical protein
MYFSREYDEECDCTKPLDKACSDKRSKGLKVMSLPSNSGIKMSSRRVISMVGEGFALSHTHYVTFSDEKGLALRVNVSTTGIVTTCSMQGTFHGHPRCAGT